MVRDKDEIISKHKEGRPQNQSKTKYIILAKFRKNVNPNFCITLHYFIHIHIYLPPLPPLVHLIKREQGFAPPPGIYT